MAQTIVIPKLNARVGTYQLPEIDFRHDPYAPIARAAEDIGNAIETRQKQHALDERNRLDAEIKKRQLIALAHAEAEADAREQKESGVPDTDLVTSLKARVTDMTSEATKGALNLFERNALREAAPDIFREVMPGVIGAQAILNKEMRRHSVGRLLDTVGESVKLDPGMIEALVRPANEALSLLPPEDQEALAPWRRGIAESFIDTLIAADPDHALKRLDDARALAESGLDVPEPLRKSGIEKAKLVREMRTREADATEEARRARPLIEFETARNEVADGLRSPSHLFAALENDLTMAGRRHIEAGIKATLEHIEAKAKASVDVGTALGARDKIAWDEEKMRGLDDHYAAVIADAERGGPLSPIAKRGLVVAFSALAGRTPAAVIREAANDAASSDPQRRIGAAHLLRDLHAADEGKGAFIRDVAPDLVKFGHQVDALTRAGIGELAALNVIDGTKVQTPLDAEARGHAFDRHVDMRALISAFAATHGTEIAGVAPDDDAAHELGAGEVDDLVYRKSDRVLFDQGPYIDDGSKRFRQLSFGDSTGGMTYGGVGEPPYDRDDPLRYDDEDLEKIGAYRGSILKVAKQLGVSEEAVAGAIAEELDDARRRGDMESVLWGTKWGYLGWRSHKDIEEQYDKFEADLAKDPRLGYEVPKGTDLARQKYNYPTLLDIGMGKIRLHTAIRMLRDYNTRYPDSDPLDLKKYNDAYDALASDLESAAAPTTAAFAGLVVAEATRWFETKAADTWAKLNSSERAALIIDYYNLGRETIVHRYQEEMERDGKYTPGLGDSGESHRANAQRVWRALYPE